MKHIVHWLETFIDTLTASSLLIHTIMVIAAVASYGNIHDYLQAGHASNLTAHALATVLGAALVVSSSRLTKLNLARVGHDRNMQVVVGVALATACVSGLLQSAEYIAHGYSWLSGTALGFGIPILLEVGPALSVALIKNIDENERTDSLKRNMAVKINDAISTALDDIKADDIRKEVEYAAQIFTREFVDSVTGEMLHHLRQANKYTLSAFIAPDTSTQAITVIDDMQAECKQVGTQLVESTEQAKSLDEVDEKILNAITNGASTPYAIAKAIGVAQTTLKRKSAEGIYIGRLPALVQAGHLLNGGATYSIADSDSVI